MPKSKVDPKMQARLYLHKYETKKESSCKKNYKKETK